MGISGDAEELMGTIESSVSLNEPEVWAEDAAVLEGDIQ